MPKLRQLSNPFCWRGKVTRIAFMAIYYTNLENPRIRKISRQKKIFPLPLIVIVWMVVSLGNFWVDFPKWILVCIRKASKANSRTLKQMIVTLLLLKTIKNKPTKISATLYDMSITRRVTMLASAKIKSQKTSFYLGNPCINDRG